MLKRAAATFQSSPAAHAALSLAIYKQKCVHDCTAKLLDAKKEAANSWLKWARLEEESMPVQQLFLKMAELDYLWIRTYRDYMKQFEAYRGYFREVLQGDKAVEENRKKYNELIPKLEKLYKQIKKMGSGDMKNKEKKVEELTLEYGKMISAQQENLKELEDKEENNKMFKLKRVRDAVKLSADAEAQFHERGYDISQTQRLLLDFYTASTYGSITPQVIETAKTNGTKLLNELEEKLKLEDMTSIPASLSTDVPIRQDSQPEELIDFEEWAEYTPIPEDEDWGAQYSRQQSSEAAPNRPLPPLPKDDAEYMEPSAPDISPSSSTYRPSATNPYYPPDKADNDSVYHNTSAPEVPKRRSARRTVKPPVPGTTRPPAPGTPRPSVPGRTAPGQGASGQKPRQAAGPPTGQPYLEMVSMDDLRDNSVYVSSDGGSRDSAYFTLADSYSGKSTGSASDSAPTRQGSATDSGISPGGSIRSTDSSQLPEADFDEVIYDTVAGDDTHMRLSDVVRASQDEQTYEL